MTTQYRSGIIYSATLALTLMASPALAQEGAANAGGNAGGEETAAAAQNQGAEAASERQAQGDARRMRLQRALELPAQAHAARERGTPNEEVSEALDALEEENVGADESAELLRVDGEAAAEHGAHQRLGDFVEAQLEQGVRGRELAEAIRNERAQRDPNAQAQRGARDGRGQGEPRGPGQGQGGRDGQGPGADGAAQTQARDRAQDGSGPRQGPRDGRGQGEGAGDEEQQRERAREHAPEDGGQGEGRGARDDQGARDGSGPGRGAGQAE